MSATKRTIRSDIPGGESYGHNGGVEARDSRKLVVGYGISLNGEIKDCEHLVVEGTIEAELQGAIKVDVAQTGFFRGRVQTQDAEIHGRFEGEMTVYGRLVIGSTGVIAGTVHYGSLDVTPGARVEGTMMPLPPQVEEMHAPEMVTEPVPAEIAEHAEELFTEQPLIEGNDNHGYVEDDHGAETIFRKAAGS